MAPAHTAPRCPPTLSDNEADVRIEDSGIALGGVIGVLTVVEAMRQESWPYLDEQLVARRARCRVFRLLGSRPADQEQKARSADV